MMMSAKTMSKFRNRTAHYIRSASRWSTIRNTKLILIRLALDGAVPASKILRFFCA
jgi:hypothetical protein